MKNITKSEIVKLTKRLIKIESTKDKPDNLLNVLNIAKEYLKGFKIEEFENNGVKSLLVYNTSTRPDRFRVVLNAHLDVVIANDNQYIPKVITNRLYG
ncbi:MAG: M20 family peptidase, partial [bacterium]